MRLVKLAGYEAFHYYCAPEVVMARRSLQVLVFKHLVDNLIFA
ncbi:hypothetical protein GBAG_2218 [Buttiauxella agrestis ATCC 33320]|uniref:Uncharacterized protein n=1 Tax=Buttiauxella agrestis ATCC 33320 TaxID=1006004 RepID=A0A085GCI9_9ENTR|nr:hypothetical protein GBAG_2218 [Buttiauxella agrestis ATCC 33320]